MKGLIQKHESVVREVLYFPEAVFDPLEKDIVWLHLSLFIINPMSNPMVAQAMVTRGEVRFHVHCCGTCSIDARAKPKLGKF